MCLNIRMPWSKKPHTSEKTEKLPRVVLHAPTEQATSVSVPVQQEPKQTTQLTQTQSSTTYTDPSKTTTTQPAKKKPAARGAGVSDDGEVRRRQAAASNNLANPNNPTNIAVYNTMMDPVDYTGDCKNDGDNTKADHDKKVESTVDTTPKTETLSVPPVVISTPSYSHTTHSSTSHSYGGYTSHSSGGYSGGGSGGGSSSNYDSGGGSSSNDYGGSSSNW